MYKTSCASAPSSACRTTLIRPISCTLSSSRADCRSSWVTCVMAGEKNYLLCYQSNPLVFRLGSTGVVGDATPPHMAVVCHTGRPNAEHHVVHGAAWRGGKHTRWGECMRWAPCQPTKCGARRFHELPAVAAQTCWVPPGDRLQTVTPMLP